MSYLKQEYLDALNRLSENAVECYSAPALIPLRDGRKLRLFASPLRPMVFGADERVYFITQQGNC